MRRVRDVISEPRDCATGGRRALDGAAEDPAV